MSSHKAWDAHLDPWCLVSLEDGTSVMFGYALRHPETGGLAWLSSSEVLKLSPRAGSATTRSGRRYRLGRRFDPLDIGAETDEGRLAFELLLSLEYEHIELLREVDRQWLMAMKAARHLAVPPPDRKPAAVTAFFRRHGDAYVAMRRAMDHEL